MRDVESRGRSLVKLAFCLVALGTGLGCGQVNAEDPGELRWSNDPNDVVLRLSRVGGMTTRRLIFTLYGSGELVMEQRTGNFTRLLQKRSVQLATHEIADLLSGLTQAAVPEWSDDALRQPPLVQQIPKVADGSTVELRLSLVSYPPLSGPVETVVRVPPRNLARHAPVLETVPQVVAVWNLEDSLRRHWEGGGQ